MCRCLRGAAPVFAKALKPLLKPGLHKLIGCSRRTQGLMVRREHAAIVRTFPDVQRHGLRFVNRQQGSGTRMLIDHLHAGALHRSPTSLPATRAHRGNARRGGACVASGLADAGVGVEAAALRVRAAFCAAGRGELLPRLSQGQPARTLPCSACARCSSRRKLEPTSWRNLPGYQPAIAPGKVLVMTAALPWWRRRRRTAPQHASDRR